VHSAPAQGSSFTVLLPAVAFPTASPDPAGDESQLLEAAAPPSSGASLLIVEDDTGVRAFTTQVLRDAGWTVFEAGNPADAFAIAARESQPLDLLLTDVVLPGINGTDLAARLRTLRPELLVLFMSGYSPEEVVASATLPMTGQLLRKPFLPATLREHVAQALNRSRVGF
jgi:DNA-binding NtrC family response regulator